MAQWDAKAIRVQVREIRISRRKSRSGSHQAQGRLFNSKFIVLPDELSILQPPSFFVQHNGGRVLFEQLGPPWPKHECMAHEQIRTASAFQDLSGYSNLGHVLAMTPKVLSVPHRVIAIGRRNSDGSFQRAVCIMINRNTSLQINDLVFVKQRIWGKVLPSALGIKKIDSTGKIVRARPPK